MENALKAQTFTWCWWLDGSSIWFDKQHRYTFPRGALKHSVIVSSHQLWVSPGQVRHPRQHRGLWLPWCHTTAVANVVCLSFFSFQSAEAHVSWNAASHLPFLLPQPENSKCRLKTTIQQLCQHGRLLLENFFSPLPLNGSRQGAHAHARDTCT